MKKHIGTICFGTVLVLYTLYAVLRIFVIPETYQKNATSMNMDLFETAAAEQPVSDTESSDPEPSEDMDVTEESSEAAEEERDNSYSDRTADNDEEERDNSYSGRTADNNDRDESENTRRGSSYSGRNDDEEDTSGDTENGSSRSTWNNSSGNGWNNTWSDNSFYGDSNEELNEDDFLDFSQDSSSYEDENIRIQITEYEEYDTHIYVADIQLTSAQYLKSAFAEDTYGRNITDTTSEIAQEHNAILAINGDYYGTQQSGYVIRNGIVYRTTDNGKDILCIYANGTMEILDSGDYTAQKLVENGVWQAFCFGPGLIEDGKLTVSKRDSVGRGMANNPRTAIGMIEPCHFIFVVADGRTGDSDGLTLYELATFMQKFDVTCAYNLDGGGSSTMVFNGELVNRPTSGGSIKERSVSDIVYIGS